MASDQRQTAIRFTGKVENKRCLVKIGKEDVWLEPNYHRVLMQLAIRRYSSRKIKEIEPGWMHQDLIVPGGPDMPKLVHYIRKEFKNHSISVSLIQSDGKCKWRLDFRRWLIHFNHHHLLETLDNDLKQDLKDYVINAKKSETSRNHISDRE